MLRRQSSFTIDCVQKNEPQRLRRAIERFDAEPMERMLTVAGKDADRVVVREVGGTWAA